MNMRDAMTAKLIELVKREDEKVNALSNLNMLGTPCRARSAFTELFSARSQSHPRPSCIRQSHRFPFERFQWTGWPDSGQCQSVQGNLFAGFRRPEFSESRGNPENFRSSLSIVLLVIAVGQAHGLVWMNHQKFVAHKSVSQLITIGDPSRRRCAQAAGLRKWPSTTVDRRALLEQTKHSKSENEQQSFGRSCLNLNRLNEKVHRLNRRLKSFAT